MLRGDGIEFPADDEDEAKKPKEPVSNDPNVVSSQQEADDIARGEGGQVRIRGGHGFSAGVDLTGFCFLFGSGARVKNLVKPDPESLYCRP